MASKKKPKGKRSTTRKAPARKAASRRGAKKAAPRRPTAKRKPPKRPAPSKPAAKRAAPRRTASRPKAKRPARKLPRPAAPALRETAPDALVAPAPLEQEPTPPPNLTARHAPVDDFTSSGDELVDIFQKYDRDRTGMIDRGEFARLLEALGQNLDEDELAVALDVVDAHHSGKISFQDFKRFWTSR